MKRFSEWLKQRKKDKEMKKIFGKVLKLIADYDKVMEEQNANKTSKSM